MNNAPSALFRAGTLITVLLCTTAFVCSTAGAADVYVNQTGWWYGGGAFNESGTPIQHAINNATAGETIYVEGGSYNENIDVSTASLTLQGEGADVVNVTATDSDDHVFEVTVDYTNISGFNVTGATGDCKVGIHLGDNVEHCSISDNAASNNCGGIDLRYYSSNNTLVNNTANSNDYFGIGLSWSKHNTLTNNAASNNCFGIYLNFSSNNTLTNNNASNNHEGIFLDSSSNDTLVNNTANSNNFGGIVLTGSKCRGYSSNNTLTNNTVNSNNCYGIDLRYYSSDNEITCNWVHNNRKGFYLTGGSMGNNISYNNIIANGDYNESSHGYEWQFYNRQSADVDATNNWWGTKNNDTINASIYDWHDDAAKGNVTYLPKLDGPAPCAPIPDLPTIVLLTVGLLMLVGCVRIGRRM
jgi:parallel beta-helix repeat protein